MVDALPSWRCAPFSATFCRGSLGYQNIKWLRKCGLMWHLPRPMPKCTWSNPARKKEELEQRGDDCIPSITTSNYSDLEIHLFSGELFQHFFVIPYLLDVVVVSVWIHCHITCRSFCSGVRCAFESPDPQWYPAVLLSLVDVQTWQLFTCNMTCTITCCNGLTCFHLFDDSRT